MASPFVCSITARIKPESSFEWKLCSAFPSSAQRCAWPETDSRSWLRSAGWAAGRLLPPGWACPTRSGSISAAPVFPLAWYSSCFFFYDALIIKNSAFCGNAAKRAIFIILHRTVCMAANHTICMIWFCAKLLFNHKKIESPVQFVWVIHWQPHGVRI